jgi:hypothetical protein
MENVVKEKAGDCWQPNRKIAWFQGGLDRIEAAYEALRHAGYYVNEFQRHPHGWDKVPGPCGAAEERAMKNLLQDLEEGKSGDAEALVKKLADAQGRMADAIDKAQDVVSAQWDVVNSVSQQLTVQLKAPRVDGATVAELFKKYQIDAGDGLSSRLVDLIVARGGKVYPEPYEVRRSRWALIER